MGFGIDRHARSRTARGGIRGLFAGKPPDAAEVGERLVRLGRRMFGERVVDASSRRLTIAFHPAASPVRIAVLPDGGLEVQGETGSIGPGYHVAVLARLAPLLDELEYEWDGDEGDPRQRMAQWLADELRAGATRIGMPAERTVLVDAAVQTALGPRDAAWRDAVLADPRRGADAFAWWDDGPGQEARSIALLAIWHAVAWRAPIDDVERAVLVDVDADLRTAHDADRALALPWAEWAAILDALGATGADVRARARAGGKPATAGYRRYPLELELAGGWLLVLPGSFVAHIEDDGERWWATDGERVVEHTSLTAHETAGAPGDSAALLAVAPERHPVIERLEAGTRLGRAEAYAEGDVRIVHGLVADAPHVAILTCKSHGPDDEWALALWRSLRR